MKKLLTCTLAVVVLGNIQAQDVHFSQFDRNPVYLNPALAGQMDGYGRFTAHYNSQWAALGAPYTTESAAFDMPFFKDKRGAYLGMGVNFIHDKAGDSNFGFINAGLAINGILPVGDGHELSLGVHSAFVQRSMDGSNLEWGSQWDGSAYNSSLAGESILVPSFSYFDFSAGINYHFSNKPSTISSNDRVWMDAGFSYQHLTNPELQFQGSGDKLAGKMNFYAYGNIDIQASRYFIRPLAKYSRQSTQQEIVGGAYFGYKIVEDAKRTGFARKSSIAFGAVYRFKDALVPGLIYEIADFSLQVSYDVNLSNLSTYTKGRGGIEISFMYVDALGKVFGGGKTNRTIM